jgi:hypothetical protein
MPLVILRYLLNVSVQLANKRGFKQTKKDLLRVAAIQCNNVSVENPVLLATTDVKNKLYINTDYTIIINVFR